jgi:acyl-homoserine lactone acylase PvdQ
VLHLLENGESMDMARRPRTGTTLWDDIATAATTETGDQIVLRALDEALAQLAITARSTDANMWLWGGLHTLRLDSIIPGPGSSLSIPQPMDATFPNGFPRGGGIEVVDASHPGVTDFDFRYGSGPSQRFVVEMDAMGPRGFNSLPGGQVFSRSSRFHRNLMELWRRNQYFAVPRTEAEVVEAHDSRVRFEPM